jgi:lipoprotein Spr
MKQLLLLAIINGFILGSFTGVNAQKKVNLHRNNSQVNQNISIKFIDGFNLKADSTSNTTAKFKKNSESNSISNYFPSSKGNYLNNVENCTSIQFKYAMILNREVESINNFELFNFINQWWGTRYRFGGSDQNGIDCSGFTEKLLTNVYGSTLPRTSKEQFLSCKKVANKELVEGDLVFFNTRSTRRRRKGISHVGFYLGNNYFVHSSVSEGVTINSLNEEYYKKKFVSGGKTPFAKYNTK